MACVRAYATFNGQRIFFGRWGGDAKKAAREAQAEFDAYLAKWLANGRKPLDEPEDLEGLTVGALVERYVEHGEAL